MTAGFDRVIKVFDIRMISLTAEALYSFSGHVATGLRKQTNIVSPVFCDPFTVLTPGEGTCALSLYSTRTGKTVSRGDVMGDAGLMSPTAVVSGYNGRGGRDRMAVVCKPGAEVFLLAPVYNN
jgi:hypothetical protein